MATIQDVNIRLVLSRLRPGAAYGWLGDGDTGHNLSVVEWRDSGSTLPTEAECIAEWGVYQTEQGDAATLRQTILTNAQSAVGKTLDTLTIAERNALIALLLYKAGGVNPRTGVVQPLNTWL